MSPHSYGRPAFAQPTAQAPPPVNCILVNRRQEGNPVLKHIRLMRWQYADIVPDYMVGADSAVLFLSLKYVWFFVFVGYMRMALLVECLLDVLGVAYMCIPSHHHHPPTGFTYSSPTTYITASRSCSGCFGCVYSCVMWTLRMWCSHLQQLPRLLLPMNVPCFVHGAARYECCC